MHCKVLRLSLYVGIQCQVQMSFLSICLAWGLCTVAHYNVLTYMTPTHLVELLKGTKSFLVLVLLLVLTILVKMQGNFLQAYRILITF